MPDPLSNTCAPDEAIAHLARGDLDNAGTWVTHIDACPACRSRFEAILQTAEDPDPRRGELPVTDFVDSKADDDIHERLVRLLGGARAEALRCLRPAEQPDEMGRLGPFRVLDILGVGGMGLVLRAEDPELGRQVALKVLRPHMAADPAARSRFRREAQAMASIEHDHVVPVHAVGMDNDVPYLAMPLLAGETLALTLQREGRLAPARIIDLGRQIALGLAAAHVRGLVHRDVTPANIWLEPRPDGSERARLLDFGLARVAAGVEVTRTGAIVGTPAYMSPEQARGQPTDHRTDLFSLGVVLYRAATGVAPFAGPDAFAVAREIVDANPPAPKRVVPDLPAPLSAIIMRLLRKDPAGRPSSAQSVADELTFLAAAKFPRKRIGSRRIALLAAAIAVAATLVVVLIPKRVVTPPTRPLVQDDGLKLSRTVDAGSGLTNVRVVALAQTEAGPVVLTESFAKDQRGQGVRVWTQDLDPVSDLPSAGEYIRSLATTPDGNRFVTVGNGALEVWALANKSAKRAFDSVRPPAPIGGILVGPQGDRLYTTDYVEAGLLREYALTADALVPLRTLAEMVGLPRHLAISPNGRWIGAASKTGKVCMWDLRADGPPNAHVIRSPGQTGAVVAFSPDSQRVWVPDGTLSGETFDLSTGRPVAAGAFATALAGTLPVTAFTDATRSWLIVVGERVIQLFEVSGERPRILGTYDVPTSIRSAAFDVRTGRLYTGHTDGLRVWTATRQ